MLLPDDRLDVAPDDVEHDHITRELKDAGVQKQGAEKLPGIGLVEAAVT